MPKRQKFEEKTAYHIYNRGLYKHELFHNNIDLQRFLWYIDIYKKKCEKDLSILAYCILPNHFHLVIINISNGYRPSYFIGNICAAYTRYYKYKYGVGRGKKYFESRFKAKEILDNEYLQQCIYYVENNPIKHGLVDKIEDRLFTSSGSQLSSPSMGEIGSEGDIQYIDWEFDF